MPFTSLAQKDEPFRIKTLVIDAGHGGKDPGNLGTGRYKTREKDIALDVAKRLGAYVEEQFPEIKVIYTRDSDVFIGLNERADIANSNMADLFISVHCNAINYASARGVETWVLGLHKNEENLQIAIKENSAIFLEDDYETKYEGFDPNSPESVIALTMMQSAFLDQSLGISSYIQRQFKERVGRRDRGVKQAGFLVLRKTTMPSILIELGFLTNPEEEDFLNSESGRVYMASAILRGFKEYKDLVEDPLPESEKTSTAGTEEKNEVSVDLRQAELKAELERKKAELDKKRGVDEKARQDSLDRVAEIAAAKIKADLEAKRKAEEAKKADEASRLAAEKAEQERKAEEARIAAEQNKQAEVNRLIAEKAKQERKAEEARIASEQNKQAEANRLVAEKAEQERKAEEARIAAEQSRQSEASRLAAEKAEKEQIEKEKQQADLAREIAEKAEIMRVAEEKGEADRQAKKEKEAALAAQKAAAEQKAAEEKRLADQRKEEERAAAELAEAEAAEKARQEALNRIDMERLKREIIVEQKAAKERERLAAEEARKKAEAEKTVKTPSPELDEEAKRLAELKEKKAEIEARLAKLEEPNEPKKKEPVSSETPKTTDASGVLFKVQIHTTTTNLERNSPLFKGLNPEQYEQDGLYKYTVGNFTNIEAAGPTQSEMRDMGFKGAFIVAFKNGERIKVNEARKLTESDGN